MVSLVRKILSKPKLKLLDKLHYESKSSSKEEATKNLVLISIVCILIPVLAITFYPLLLQGLKHFGFTSRSAESISNIIIPLAFGVITFDVIQELISKEIEALYGEFRRNQEILQGQISGPEFHERVYQSSKDEYVSERHSRYYHARILRANKSSALKIRPSYSKNFNARRKSLEENFRKNEIVCREIDKAREISCFINHLESKDWQEISSFAARFALQNEENKESIVQKMNTQGRREKHFFMNIYLLLEAWLVSSVESSVSRGLEGGLMPVEDIIDVNSSNCFDVSYYKKSLNFVKDIFSDYNLLLKYLSSREKLRSKLEGRRDDCLVGLNDYIDLLESKLEDILDGLEN